MAGRVDRERRADNNDNNDNHANSMTFDLIQLFRMFFVFVNIVFHCAIVQTVMDTSIPNTPTSSTARDGETGFITSEKDSG